jgi:tetratricopeptide (TPR) repeat protein
MIGQTLGHYRIVESIGAGGMGVVYRAHDERLDRDVALKVLPARALDNEASKKRFRREALALSRLNHPNIATVHDFDSQEGVDFLVMELIHGAGIDDRLLQGALPEKDVVRLGIQAAQGLEAAHEQGIVHRDLKPGNLRVTQDGRLKILDFGLATLRAPLASDDSAPTLSAADIHTGGTLPYMAPEQLRGERIDPRTDIYGLGTVLYEMATGRRPFDETLQPRLIDAILHQDPLRPSAVNPRVDPALDAIVLKAMDREPGRRYQSARELQVDLERLAAGITVTAPPRRRGVIGRRWAPRMTARRWAVGLAGTAGLLALGLALWTARSRPALSFAPRDWVLLADLDNQTGNALFDTSLQSALTVSLEQSAHANVFPPARTSAALKRMGKPLDARIDEALGREICVRENIKGLVTAVIGRAGSRYALSARLVDPRTGDTVRAYSEQAEGDEQILPALGRIASGLRRDLGESLASLQASDRPLPQVTTSSLQALKSFAEAGVLWKKGQYDEAVQLYRAALDDDPQFAMAHAALGNAYYSHIYSNAASGKQHYDKALQHASRVTERERMYIQASYSHSLGHHEAAERQYRLYLTAYPDDARVWYALGNLLMRNQQYEQAIAQYRQALRIRPDDANALINIATSHNSLGDAPRALSFYGKAFELEPGRLTSGNLNHEYGFALVKNGEEARARAVFRQAVEKPEMKAAGLRSMALLDMYRGRYREARARLEEAILLNQAAKAGLSEARNRLFLATVLEGQGEGRARLAQMDRALEKLESLPPQVWLAALVGRGFARASALPTAERVLALVRKQADIQDARQSSDLHLLEGELERARGRHERALELLMLADREYHGPLSADALARAHASAGRTEQAIAHYEALLALHAKAVGWEAQSPFLAAHVALARAYRSQGQNERAGKAVETFLELWKDADPELLPFREAVALRKEVGRP